MIDGTTGADKPAGSKLTLNLPVLGNGSVSAPATTANSPDRGNKPSLATNTLIGLQNTLGKITGAFSCLLHLPIHFLYYVLSRPTHFHIFIDHITSNLNQI